MVLEGDQNQEGASTSDTSENGERSIYYDGDEDQIVINNDDDSQTVIPD